ncbi:aminoglycoside phosphotransferase family protein [Nonomuraea sp. WAC 01424]|uniref:phosphotransferase n=1 Tax=Nonomuraea sp. WAC 01424 TaxID=2203200 RepID=UPI001C8C0451|nr:aminoglycoside phosphotransferase family protein [Nonomuraea sp. WAC 01424]
MRDRPTDLDESLLVTALEAWGIEATGLTHAPVGFGDHHWTATGADGRRWFLTAADLVRKPEGAFEELRRAMETAAALATGLGFVVAPVPDLAGGAFLRPLGPRYALSLFPFVEGVGGEFGDELTARDRAEVIDLLAELHAAPPPASVPARPLELAGRAELERALAETGRPWTGGPYAEPARALVAGHAEALRARLREFDRGSRDLGRPVVTHGEPHPGNLLRHEGRRLLVDWDTVGLAVPERDLWLVARTPADLARYAAATGRTPDPAALGLYRLRWSLEVVAEFVAWFRAPHGSTRDAELSWTALTETLDDLADQGDGVASAQ